MAASPSTAPPAPAVRLRMAKKPRKARQPNPDTLKPLRCPYPNCKMKGVLYEGQRKLKKHMETHYGLLEGRCLKCDREFNLVTSLRNHCKMVCGPQHLPKRHLPTKGQAKLEWEALLAPAAELVAALEDGEEQQQQQVSLEQQQQTALLCAEALEREEEGQEEQLLNPPPRSGTCS